MRLRYRVYFDVDKTDTSIEMDTPKTAIFTIGHSNHTWERFLELLTPHRIELLVDVRSYPRSRFAPWSNREKLDAGLRTQGIEYRWMGNQLGGMPRGPGRSTDLERISVDEWYRTRSEAPDFLAAIAEVSQMAMKKRLVLMCSEGDPERCHRTLLLAPMISNLDFELLHILPNPVGTAVRMDLV